MRTILLAMLLLLGQSLAAAQNASVSITSFPAWGQSGAIKGTLTGVSPSSVRVYVLLFLPDTGWSDPTNCTPISVNGDGTFQVNLDLVHSYNNPLMFRYWTRMNVYAVQNFNQCTQAAEAVPFFLERNAVVKMSMPRLPQFRTITFSGMEWFVKDPPNRVFPGPNYFIGDNVSVDALGRLHLKITKCGDSWCSAELFSKDRFGYGSYKFTVDSSLNNLDPKTTLGLFTWDEYNSDRSHMEWDIEIAKWGDSSATTNAQFVVQPYTVPGNLRRVLINSALPTVHQVNWLADSVAFSTSVNNSDIAAATITSATTPIPQPGDARVHINFYVAGGGAPVIGVEREIVISGFQHSPSATQTGFAQTTDSLPYTATTRLASISALNGNCPAWIESDSPWLQVQGPQPINGSGTIAYSVTANPGSSRTGNLILHSGSCNLTFARQVLTLTQAAAPCGYALPPSPITVADAGGDVFIPIGVNDGCPWNATSDSSWLVVTSKLGSNGPGSLSLRVSPNVSPAPRLGTVIVGDGSLSVLQSAALTCVLRPSTTGQTVGIAGGSLSVSVNSSLPTCTWTASSPVSWVTVSGGLRVGSGTATISVNANLSPFPRSAVLTVGGQPVVITQTGVSQSAATQFVPVVPCRVMDTRNPASAFGGPFLEKSAQRSIPVAASGCGIPGDASAYSLNVTAVPLEGLGYLSLFPTGGPLPGVSTLNSYEGSVVANAAIVPAGAGSSISLYASNATDVVMDINGYFVNYPRADALAFYTVSPCRLVDTRNPVGAFGGPALGLLNQRTFPLLSGACGIPVDTKAYSLNYTVVPRSPLAFLTTWPASGSAPLVSTLNSPEGRVLANAAVVPAGVNGAVSVFAYADPLAPTDVVIDVNGRFAPAGSGGLSFYPIAPCRAVDTRVEQVFPSPFGPPAIPRGGSRSFPLTGSRCGLPANAAAYSLNVTVVPRGPLSYLTIWPTGIAQPFVSTLNSPDGRVLANAAIVPSGINGAISVYVLTESEPCDVIIDVNGYFAP